MEAEGLNPEPLQICDKSSQLQSQLQLTLPLLGEVGTHIAMVDPGWVLNSSQSVLAIGGPEWIPFCTGNDQWETARQDWRRQAGHDAERNIFPEHELGVSTAQLEWREEVVIVDSPPPYSERGDMGVDPSEYGGGDHAMEGDTPESEHVPREKGAAGRGDQRTQNPKGGQPPPPHRMTKGTKESSTSWGGGWGN